MIAIIDYDAGNVKSVSKALEKIGLDTVLTSDRAVINASRAMILPGVGSFGKAMENLQKLDLVDCIQNNVKKGKFFLGICLGMQMLFDVSYEDGEWPGLGLIGGSVRRFDPGLKIPHMGWNALIKNREDAIGRQISSGEFVYFVHSYYAQMQDWQDVVYYAEYGVNVPAVVRKDNVIGMQFHPEKSSDCGIQLLKNFGELIR